MLPYPNKIHHILPTFETEFKPTQLVHLFSMKAQALAMFHYARTFALRRLAVLNLHDAN